MLSHNTIQIIARKLQTNQLNIRREYIQHLFLSYLYKISQSDRLLFKGGTALRIIYNSPRFSEDLDFSTSIRGTRQIESIVFSALEEIEREGIQIQIRESKKTSGGYLALAAFSLHGEWLDIELNISRRRGKLKGEATTIAGDFVPPYIVMMLSQETLVAEKIQALQMRKKPRDFYDLYYLLRARLIAPQKKSVLRNVEKTIASAHVEFEKELRDLLPKSHWSVVRDFKKVLIQEIRRHV